MALTLFHNGTVWADGSRPTTDALLVDDGVITAVGSDAHQRADEAGDVERVDLEGGFLMPSFGDGHAHPMYGGLEFVGPAVRPCTSIDEIVEAVRRFAKDNPDEEWIVGASYDGSLAEGGLFDARWLDEAVDDRPVVLRAWDYHTVWCNSVALERAGITPETPDPQMGEIPHREDGSVLGTLREWGAVDLVMAAMPPRDEDTRVAALGTAADYYLARGVTWVQDAWVEPADVDTYCEAARRGALRMRFNLALYADPRHFEEQIAGYAAARDRVVAQESPFLTANTVKFFADGVVENETGALLQPYCSGLHSHGGQERSDSGDVVGMKVWEGDGLAQACQRVDELGFQIHIHAIGDAAVRQALDAIEYAVTTNGPRDRRPVIAHVQLVDDVDLQRFADLGVIPCMQPLWAQQDALMTVLTIPRLGRERSDKQYRMRTLDDSGAPLSFGSDWPVSSGAPLDGIAVAVSRQTAEGEPAGGWTPEEIVGIDRALTAYTEGVAKQAFAESVWGRLAPGASADLVLLDRDPRNASAADLPGITIRATYVRGALAHSAP